MTQSPSSIEFSTNGDEAEPERLAQLTAEHFQNHCLQVWQRTDRMFAGLMALQWLAGIGVALWITPRTWIGATSSLHLHVLAAISPTDEFAVRLMKPIKQADLFNALTTLSEKSTRLRNHYVKTKSSTPPWLRVCRSIILVAEDNIINQKVAMGILLQFGYHTDLVVSGKEAVEAAERQKYDLLFMDIQMPNMDGLEATRLICSRMSPSERPYIVAMTANAMKEDRDRCLSAGMDDYLSKPIRPEEIKAAIERAAMQLSRILRESETS